jgi:23S rRNA (guanosine2251-2'-O)-methyltransferase
MYSKNKKTYKVFNSENMVCGRNPVLELLKADKRSVNKIMLSHTARGTAISEIVNLAKKKRIAVHNVPPEKLDIFLQNSQGVAAEVSPTEYIEIEDLIKESKENEKPLLVILDGIEDPHNLGAIIRNCVVFGANGIIIPKWRAVGVNETVSKSSAGATEYISISRVANINQTIELLKENGFWVMGAEKGGEKLNNFDFPFPLVIIIGSEGAGMHNLTKKLCDFIVSIPQTSKVSSLNASCAAAVFLYEIFKRISTESII